MGWRVPVPTAGPHPTVSKVLFYCFKYQGLKQEEEERGKGVLEEHIYERKTLQTLQENIRD